MSSCRAWYRRGVERSPFLFIMGTGFAMLAVLILVLSAVYAWAFLWASNG